MKKILFYLCTTSILFIACKKNNDDDALNNLSNGNSFMASATTSVKGIVLDKNSLPIPGVNITLKGNSTTTSDKGLFHFNSINPSDRDIIHFNKGGFVTVLDKASIRMIILKLHEQLNQIKILQITSE